MISAIIGNNNYSFAQIEQFSPFSLSVGLKFIFETKPMEPEGGQEDSINPREKQIGPQ